MSLTSAELDRMAAITAELKENNRDQAYIRLDKMELLIAAARERDTLRERLATAERALEAVGYFWGYDPKAFGDEASVTSLAGQFAKVADQCRAALAALKGESRGHLDDGKHTVARLLVAPAAPDAVVTAARRACEAHAGMSGSCHFNDMMRELTAALAALKGESHGDS